MGNSSPRNVFERLGDFFFSRPSPERAWKTNVALSVVMLVVSAICIGKSGLVGNFEAGVAPSDLSLSGTWKIRFDDRPEYAQAGLNDTDWCLINVPGGGQPVAGNLDHPAASCPKDSYPRELMRNHTFWYRKTFTIPATASWKKPTLFLGSIKREGWVYWDGKPIGSMRLELESLMLMIPSELANPGQHELAIRATSLGDQFPGLFHAFPKGVALGDLSTAAPVVFWNRQAGFLEPFAVILFQFSALVILGFLAFRSQNPSNDFFWLAMYFGAAAINACSVTAVGDCKWLMDQCGIIAMSIALIGYGTNISNPFPVEKEYVKRVALYFGSLVLAIVLTAYEKGNFRWLAADALDKVVVYLSLIYVVASIVGMSRSFVSSKQKFEPAELCILPVLGVMHFLYAYMRYSDGTLSATFFHLPVITCAVTILVMLFAIEEHVSQERKLAFFGRYIRKGLKQLLGENQGLAISGQKVFRGRKIPIMKIDIVGHTMSTYGMPYGIKREFQDLWFTHIDEVVAGHIFLDKGQGDGSYYYFDEQIPGGSCGFALSAALRIINHTVAEFDQAFQRAVTARVGRFSELKTPIERFMQQYLEKTGQSFEAHRTRVKIALVFGYVDEGLWGLPSQGHYDVEGDLLSLAARLESKANEAEVVMSEPFVQSLIEEGAIPAGYELEWKTADLKGIGTHQFAVLRQASKNKGRSEAA